LGIRLLFLFLDHNHSHNCANHQNCAYADEDGADGAGGGDTDGDETKER
jgi:hypothetical protein